MRSVILQSQRYTRPKAVSDEPHSPHILLTQRQESTPFYTPISSSSRDDWKLMIKNTIMTGFYDGTKQNGDACRCKWLLRRVCLKLSSQELVYLGLFGIDYPATIGCCEAGHSTSPKSPQDNPNWTALSSRIIIGTGRNCLASITQPTLTCPPCSPVSFY